MALITCPECGKEISDKAKVCPNCGAPTPSAIKKKENTKTAARTVAIRIFLLIMTVAVIAAAVWYNSWSKAKAEQEEQKRFENSEFGQYLAGVEEKIEEANKTNEEIQENIEKRNEQFGIGE